MNKKFENCFFLFKIAFLGFSNFENNRSIKNVQKDCDENFLFSTKLLLKTNKTKTWIMSNT